MIRNALLESVATGVLVLALATACSEGGTATVSIEDVVANPQKFAGEQIRIDGWALGRQDNDIGIVPRDCLPGNTDEEKERCRAIMDEAGGETVAAIVVYDLPYTPVQDGDHVIISGTFEILHAGAGYKILSLKDATLVDIK